MSYRNIYLDPTADPVFCYRSGMVVYEEMLADGSLYAIGWNGAGYTQNVIECAPSRLDVSAFTRGAAFYLEVDGRAADGTWEQIDFAQREETNENGVPILHGALRLRSTRFPLEVTVHTALDGTSILERYLTLRNTGAKPLAISALTPMCGGLEITEDWQTWAHDKPLYRVGYMDDCRWAHEGQFRWHDLPNAGYSVTGRFMRDRFRHPMFLLQNRACGTTYICQLAWSGGYAFDFDLNAPDNGDAALYCGVRLDSLAPFLLLQDGESYDTPRVHMGMLFGGVDDAVQSMHTHLRRSVFTIPEARGVYGWIEAGIGPERTLDFAAIRHFADTAAAVGAQTLIIDAGWFCAAGREDRDWWIKTGDWTHDPDKYPDAMAQVRDYIHAKGLLFGLWADIESIGRGSDLFKTHPDWALGNSNILDMTRPEIAAHAEAELTRIITTYQLDLFRLDNNTNYRDFAQYTAETDRQAAVSRYYEAVYAMYARLRRKFPDVVFENCAGGGGRSDLGLTALFSHTWVSDWQKAPRSAVITNGMTMALPPERVDRLIGGMGSHAFGSITFQARHAIFGRPTVNDFNAVGSDCNPQQMECIRHALAIYKQIVLPYIRNSRIWHHTPALAGENPDGDCILERSAANGEAGILGVFRLAGLPQEDTVTVFPRGADTGAQYRVTLDNDGQSFLCSGFRLRSGGVRIRLPSALQSELLIYRKIEEGDTENA